MLWDLAEGKRLYNLEAGEIIHALCFSPNRYWLCAATTNCIKVHSLPHNMTAVVIGDRQCLSRLQAWSWSKQNCYVVAPSKSLLRQSNGRLKQGRCCGSLLVSRFAFVMSV